MSWKGSYGRANQQGTQAPKGSGIIKPVGGASVKPAGGNSTSGSIKPISPLGGAVKAGVSAVKANPAASVASIAALKAKVSKMGGEFTSLEKQVNTTLENAKKVVENEKATTPALKSCLDMVEKVMTKITDFQNPITKEREEARKAGPAASACITELSGLLEKTQKLRQSVTIMTSKLKPKVAKAQTEAETKAKEAKDSASFKPVLAKLTKEVAAIEDAVNAVAKKADPAVDDKPEGEELDKIAESIETAAGEAAKKLAATRKELQEKMSSTQAFAQEAKKSAQASLTELQKKLADSGKRIGVYQLFKKELPKLIASKEALSEITELLDGHEKALTNATKLSEMTKIDKEKVDAIDSHLELVKKAITESNSLVAKIQKPDAVTQASLLGLKKKSEEMNKKIQAIYTRIKKQRDVIRSAEFADTATEMLEKAEAGWSTCQEAEMPFLTGVEVLPGEQNDIALKAANDAISTTSAAVNDAKAYVKKCLQDSKTYEKELGDKVTAELTPFIAKFDAIGANVAKFKKETAERKVTAIMSGAIDSVESLEAKLSTLEQEAAPLSATGFEDEAEEKMTASIESTKSALADVRSQFSETKKLFSEKLREAKAPQNDAAAMNINSRLNDANNKVNKVFISVQSAEKVVRSKSAAKTGEEKMSQAEAEVEKVKQYEASKFTVESVKEFDVSLTSAMNAVKAAGSVVHPHVAGAPGKVKEALQALVDRKGEALKSLEKLKADTKEAREEVLTEAYLADAETHTKAAEKAADNMEEAEKPFVVGGDLPLSETLSTVKKCEEAALSVKQAMAEASKVLDQKSRDVKPFGEAVAKKAREGFVAMTERVRALRAKLLSFEKDLKDRSKAARVTESTAKVDEVEASLSKTVAAAEPFTKEGGADISEADAEAPLKAFMDAEKELNPLLVATKAKLSACMGEQKDNKENTELLKKLRERVMKVSEELAKVKKHTNKHEQRVQGKLMLAEATEQVATLDAIVKKATEACAPLLEQGGKDFLIDHSVDTLVAALQAYMKEKEKTEEDIFKELGTGKDMKEKEFVAFLGKLPEAIARDALNAFSAERHTEIFKRVSSSGKKVSLADFKGMFKRSYSCITPVAITNSFATEGSETLCKLTVNSVVEVLGTPKEDDAGLLRVECKHGEHQGWVTIKQKKVAYLNLATSLSTFYAGMEKEISEANKSVAKVSASVNEKSKPAPNDEASLKEARTEIAKLKEKVTEATKAMNELQKKVGTAKRDYAAKEKTESNAHIEARNMKEAAPFLEGPKAKLEAVEGIAMDAENAASSLTSLSGEELLAFATPASVLEVVEKAHASLAEKIAEAKEAINEQTKLVAEVTPQTSGTAEAKSQLKQIQAKVGDAAAKTTKLLATVKSKCTLIVNPKLEVTSSAIRKFAQKEKLSGEALFDKFKDGDTISQASFSKLIDSVDGAPVAPEVAKLICQKLGKDGITKDAFLAYVVVYYKVTKTIAFTDVMDIGSCKTIRKAAIGEILELLEDPVKDETHGVTRIRAKSTKEPVVEGWVTLAGNQGSAFLEKTKKA